MKISLFLTLHLRSIREPPVARVGDIGLRRRDYDLDPHPNVLRALIGESQNSLVKDDIAVLETNLDDATSEVLGGLQETLADAGARDVSIIARNDEEVPSGPPREGHL